MLPLEAPLFSLLSIAPMIDWSDTYFRMLMRLLAPNALLYTEMQTPNAILHQPKRALYFHPTESPVALQLGGSDPKALATAAKAGEAAGFSEINLNLGCPSHRVLAGRFGACLMNDPSLVAECLAAIKSVVSIPVTAKTRIGVDNNDSYAFFKNFVDTLIGAGCDKLIVHARKAWLNGLNPKQNRTIPPLRYEYVHRIKAEMSANVPVIINGQIETLDSMQMHLEKLDGVMIGRLACRNPYAIAELHHALYPSVSIPTRAEVLEKYFTYATAQSGSLQRLFKPILNLVHGLSGARVFKQTLLRLTDLRNDALTHQLTEQLREMERSLDGFSDSILVN